MKKTITICAIAVVVAAGLCMADVQDKINHNDNEKVVLLSRTEWQEVKDAVDSTNVCHISSQNVTIAVTNALPEIKPIHHFSYGRGPDRKDCEPKPYVGQ